MPKSLVLVVGAGASKEVNLPVGSELRTNIARALDIRYEGGYNRISGDGAIDEAFRELARERSEDVNLYLQTSRRIRDAMPQAISIDNFIDSHRGDARLADCGKLAIARCILAAEANSSLFVDHRTSRHKIDFERVEPTWFNAFFHLVHENCQESELNARMQKVTIITFNYDRCIEHYLHGALQNYYSITPARATAVMADLQVFHPYGSVGRLPWQGHDGTVDYGATVNGRGLIEAARGLRTFTEGVDPEKSEVHVIRSTLQEADRIAFLGFAFHPLNVGLLFPQVESAEPALNRPVFATGAGMSAADGEEITYDLDRRRAIFRDRFRFRNDLTCAQLFKEYGRSLRLS
jgi:hypothetical protein